MFSPVETPSYISTYGEISRRIQIRSRKSLHFSELPVIAMITGTCSMPIFVRMVPINLVVTRSTGGCRLIRLP